MNLLCFALWPGRGAHPPGILVDRGTATHLSFWTGSKETTLSPARADRGVATASTAAAAAARRAPRRVTSAAPSVDWVPTWHRMGVTWMARALRSVGFEARSAVARETAKPSWDADADIGFGRARGCCRRACVAHPVMRIGAGGGWLQANGTFDTSEDSCNSKLSLESETHANSMVGKNGTFDTR